MEFDWRIRVWCDEATDSLPIRRGGSRQSITPNAKIGKTNLYYYQDGSGSTSHLASSGGVLNEYYRYDLQGAPLFYNAGGTQITASAYGIRNLFNGEQWYNEIGLYDLRHRFYSPDIGRFIQPDPAGHDGGDNLYRYCRNNPLKNTDPMGMSDGPIWDPNPWLGAFPSPYATDFVNNWYDWNSWFMGTQDAAAMQYPPGYYSFDNGVAAMEATLAQEHSFILSPPLPAYNSPLATNFNTALPLIQSPTSGASVKLSHRADLVNVYHDDTLSRGLVLTDVGHTAVELTLGGSSIGSNGKVYFNAWAGNKYVSTLRLAGPLKATGGFLFLGSVGYDSYRVLTGQLSPTHAGINTGFGALGFTGIGLIPSLEYSIVDEFYPGGWLGDAQNPGFFADYGRDMAATGQVPEGGGP